MSNPEMSAVERYLCSERARDHVRQTVAGYAYGISINCHGVNGPSNPDPYVHWYADEYGCWVRIRASGVDMPMPHGKPPRVYFLPATDRYIVTDLGEGVRSLRLRTGRVYPWDGPAKLGFGKLGVHMVGDAIELDEVRCDATELPKAICRVLLASFRVANLEVK